MKTHLVLGVLCAIGSACGESMDTGSIANDGPIDGGMDPEVVTSSIGTNLTGVIDWSAEWAFVDAFKASRAWISSSSSQWDDGRALDLDASGWVRSLAAGQLARTLVLPEGHYPAGRYTVLYEGSGTLEYSGGGARDAAASTPGRDVVVVNGTSPVIVTLTATNAANYLRNIRFVMPGGVCTNDAFRACDVDAPCHGAAACTRFEDNYATQVFHPTFLARVRGYRALRFMDWMETNNSTVTDRAPAVTDARWTLAGVPVEVLLDLANRLHADAWLNVPHQATDAYVHGLAVAAHEQLAPGRRVYVEYSNEIWNGIFAQGTYVEAKGVALGLASTGFEARLRYQSQRSVEIFQIFEQVFAADPQRLVRVLASQAANAWVSRVLLDHGDARAHTDALAIAPYFGGYLGGNGEAARVRAMNVDALVGELTTVAVPEALDWVTAQATEAQERGVALIAYEAGNHLVGIQGIENDATVNALFDAVNRDPRMKQLYTTYLEGWKARGGELLVHFVNCSAPTKWGRWGALEYLDQPRAEAPKYDAVMTFAETHPAWW